MKSAYSWLLWIFTLSGLGAIIGLMSSSASEKNRLVGSFSGMQLLAVIGAFALMSLIAFAAIQLRKNHPVFLRALNALESSPLVFQVVFLAILFLIGLLFGLDNLPANRFTGYLSRLALLLLWLKTISVISLAFLVYRNLALRGEGIGRRLALPAAGLLLILALPGLVILTTHHGLMPGGDDAPTVRLTYFQLYLAFLVGFATHTMKTFLELRAQRRGFSFPKISVLIPFLLIWLCAVLIWNQTPFEGSFNALGPFPPRRDFVPSADSIRFDLPGQTALVGLGFNGHTYVDNAFYGLFVMFLHLLTGQNYHQAISVQILFLALAPAVIFLMANHIGSTAGGVSAALLYIFREANIIHTADDHWMVSVKVFITEPFITLLLCLIVFLFILWMKQPSRLLMLCLVGGLFGLSTMVRANPWFFLIGMGFLIMLVLWREPSRMVFSGLLLCVFVLAGILPWMWRCQRTIGTPFYMVYKYRHSVVEERYLDIQPQDFKQGTPDLRGKNVEPLQLKPVEFPQDENESIIVTIADHFLFNYLNTFFILPGFDQFDEETQLTIFPNHLVSAWENSNFSVRLLYLAGWLIQLFLCSSGIIYAIRRLRLAGLVPLFYAITYHAGNALATTSGSRYSQPVDWVFFLYFSMGAFSLIGLNSLNSIGVPVIQSNSKAPFLQPGARWILLITWISFFSLGLFLPLSDVLFPQKYPGSALETPLLLPITREFQPSLLDYRQAGSVIYAGRLIYPMYYKHGSEKFYGPDNLRDQDRLFFWLVGSPALPWYGQKIFLLLDKDTWPEEFLGGKDVLVATCPPIREDFLQAAAVFLVLEDRPAIIRSSVDCTQP